MLFDIAVIFYNSSLDSKSSSKISLKYADKLNENYKKEQLELPAESFHKNPQTAEHLREESIAHSRSKYNERLRNCLHMFEFFVLTFFAVLFFNTALKSIYRFNILYSFLFGVINAFADETHQIFVNGRDFEMVDILLDSTGCMAGAVLGCAAFLLFRKFIIGEKY